MSSRAQKALLGFVSDLGGMIALTIITFIAAPIILELTSQTLYGFWVTTISILGYLALTDLGLGMSLTRFVASMAFKGDSKNLNGIINTAFFTFCGIGLVFFLIGYSILPYIPSWFKIPKEESELVLSAYRVAIISGALALPLSVFSGIVVGFQQMGVINISKNIISIVGVGLSIILLYSEIGLVSLPLATLFTVITSSIVSFIYAKKYFPELKLSLLEINKNDLKKLVSFGGYFQLGRVANTVALSSDSIVIASTLGAGSVTPYSFTSKLPIIFSVTLASKLPNAIFPAMTEMFANNEMDKLREIYKRLTFFSVRLALFGGALIFIINPTFVKLWVGQENYGGYFLNFVFVLWAIFDTIYRGTTAIVYASGDLKKWTIASFLEAVFNIIISLTLIGPFGLAGVALGTLLSKMLTTGFYIPYWVCRKLDISAVDLIKKSIIPSIIRSIPSIGITFLLAYYLSFNNDWLWLIIIGVTLSTTNFLMFEGLALIKSSKKDWRVRLRNLILMKDEY
jgi:O-antigen/teichoic acid export membrane protein